MVTVYKVKTRGNYAVMKGGRSSKDCSNALKDRDVVKKQIKEKKERKNQREVSSISGIVRFEVKRSPDACIWLGVA